MPKALIADDSSFMRMIIRRILEKNGFTVVAEAENGTVCAEQYKDYWPDIVTLDVTMEEKDGIQVLKELMEINPDAKVIMISSMGQEAIINEAILTGAKSFIIKPFKEDQFILALNKAVEG